MQSKHQIPKSWKLAKLKDIIQRTQLGTTERGETACGPNISLIKMGNLGWGCFDLADVEKVCRDKINTEIDILRDGEILFNTRNAANLVGKSAVWRDIGSEAVADNNLNRFTLLSDSDPDFVVAYLNDGKGKKSIGEMLRFWRFLLLLLRSSTRSLPSCEPGMRPSTSRHRYFPRSVPILQQSVVNLSKHPASLRERLSHLDESARGFAEKTMGKSTL
jgi:hypothetical protein